MYVLKGFATHALLANNTPGQNNAIGEISNQSLTYSREIGSYVNSNAPNITLLSFLSALDGVAQPIDADFETRTTAILQWIYNQSLTTSGQMFADQFLQQILVQFQSKASNFACGNIVTDGTHYIPEWVSWQDTVSTTPNYVKVWFADASFMAQYDEFQIIVVPPIANLDDFFKSASDVQAAVNARNDAQMMQQIQQAKGGKPETIIRADIYNWYDPLSTGHLIPTTWATLIYGAAGNNIDSIKDALQEYILANSTHTRDQWAAIFPDIFKRTEFIMVPNWGNYAIPNKSTQAGIYSPVANMAALNALIASFATTYPAAHINSHACAVAHPYKSLQLGVIGSIENRENKYELTDEFPDYIAVASTSTDFNRMSQDTQNWAELLEQMLLVAESMGPFTSIPQGMTRLTRDGKLYVVVSYDNVHYLVAAKYNFPTPT